MTTAKVEAKQRDGYKCVFCGMSNEEHRRKHNQEIHAHHIVKESDNGEDHRRNYITVCRPCHETIEKTQADAVSQLRQNILDTVEEYTGIVDVDLDEYATKDYVDSEIEGLKGDDEMVKKNCYYNHSDYGVVRVKELDAETYGATRDGLVKEVVVSFVPQEAETIMRMKERIDVFLKNTGSGSDTKTHLERELRQ